ncbi:hypothetical protein JFL43_17940 [Viridibacillus sp. YIM B01967]|uniref:Uncharacterized protein n=1 Tax=Viridibacillus soli TaxID=2798301 RepID=A0ABS1HC86_9BACL|nr:hypothetical protein [Viridibacillus soli]MBK3496707.1 hypothetical protein [Viridibacillus soli]
MKQRRKKLKKGMAMSTIVACILLFGSMGVGVEAKAATNKTQQTSKSVGVTQVAATVSKKGVLTFPKQFSMKKVISELKPEAANLVKIYGDSLNTGKTTSFNSYVNKHVAEKSNDNYLLGHKYVRDNYSRKVKAMRKGTSKKNLSIYSKALKKVTTSEVKVYNTYKGTGFATFTYEFRPKNFDAFGTVTVQFKFSQLNNGKYVLENLYYIY